MTNKEILHADVLDILFENRNKAYGAYALRRNYNQRLQWALGISLSIVLFLLMFDLSSVKNSDHSIDRKKEINLSTVDLPETKKPDLPKPKVEPPRKQIIYTDQIKIVPNTVKAEMPDMTAISTADISDKMVDGTPSSDTVQTKKQGDVQQPGPDRKDNNGENILPKNSDAEYPGGVAALTRFLTKYLKTPGDLADGEKKIVLVRFMVDADGAISKTEIVQSDGDEYSKEVVRVLAKMPKWIPATQNGIKVATWFTQPVSFIGVE